MAAFLIRNDRQAGVLRQTIATCFPVTKHRPPAARETVFLA
jgi:hypothetical protein